MLMMLPFHHQNTGTSKVPNETLSSASISSFSSPDKEDDEEEEQSQQPPQPQPQLQVNQDGEYHLQKLLSKMLEANEVENRALNPHGFLNPTPMECINTDSLIEPDLAISHRNGIDDCVSANTVASYPTPMTTALDDNSHMLNPRMPINPLAFPQPQSSYMNQPGVNPGSHSNFFLAHNSQQGATDYNHMLLIQQQQQQHLQQQQQLKFLLAQKIALGNAFNNNTTAGETEIPQKIPAFSKDKNTAALETLGTTSIERRKKNEPYFDASKLSDPPPKAIANRRARGGVTEAFPEKLHRLIEECRENGDEDIIGFLPHGRAFSIYKPEEFVNKVMPKYFKQSRLSSFQRQLNLYGFTRIVNGRDAGGYYHELFLKGRPALAIHMRRVGIPQVTSTQRSMRPQGNTPDFYRMPPVQPDTEGPSRRKTQGGENESDEN